MCCSTKKHRSWVTCVVIRFSMNRFVGFTQIDPGWSEASEEKQRLGTSSACRHNAWAAMLDWCLLRFCCLVFKKPTCLTGMWYVFSWKELEVWMWYEWQWHQTFPIFRDTCFLNLIEVGGVSVARSMSLRWRGRTLALGQCLSSVEYCATGADLDKISTQSGGFPIEVGPKS